MITKIDNNKHYRLESYENYWIYFDEQYLFSITKNFPKKVKLEENENLIELEGQEIFESFNNKPWFISNNTCLTWKLKLIN